MQDSVVRHQSGPGLHSALLYGPYSSGPGAVVQGEDTLHTGTRRQKQIACLSEMLRPLLRPSRKRGGTHVTQRKTASRLRLQEIQELVILSLLVQ